jgi:hypothetical protein
MRHSTDTGVYCARMYRWYAHKDTDLYCARMYRWYAHKDTGVFDTCRTSTTRTLQRRPQATADWHILAHAAVTCNSRQMMLS